MKYALEKYKKLHYKLQSDSALSLSEMCKLHEALLPENYSNTYFLQLWVMILFSAKLFLHVDEVVTLGFALIVPNLYIFNNDGSIEYLVIKICRKEEDSTSMILTIWAEKEL